MRKSLFGASLAVMAVLALSGPALAEELRFHAHLSGGQEEPAVETDASGMAEITFDTETNMLSWTLEYEGLSGEATAAHFHGPAHPGETAPPVIPIEEFESGSEGSAELTDELVTELMNGHLYVNVHTEANPSGEIRGQVLPVMD